MNGNLRAFAGAPGVLFRSLTAAKQGKTVSVNLIVVEGGGSWWRKQV